MKLKFFVICLLSINMAACFNSAQETETNKLKEQKQAAADAVDFKKAALLNVEMGEAYLAQGQVTRAKQKFLHALELKPKLPEAHTSIGYFYETVGDLVEAEQHYREAISLGDRKGRFYNNYGTFLCRQQRFKEADKAFNNAIKDKQYTNTAEVYENAGVCALKQPDIDRASKYFETAIKRDPNRYMASLELAHIEFNKHNFLLAKEYLERYKAQVSPNARSLLLTIRLNKELGNKNEMASAIMQLKNMFPKSTEYKEYIESVRHG